MHNRDWLIVLVQPMYSKRELNADSNYVVYTQLIRAMLTVRPKWHFYVIFPDANSGYLYEPDGFFALPNVTRIPQRISTRKFSNAVSFDGQWYDMLLRRLGFDVIWCNLIEAAGALKFAGTSTYEAGARPFLVGAHNYVIHKSLPYVFNSMEGLAVAQVAGAIHADANVFNSDHCKWMFTDTARMYLNDTTVERIEKTSQLINYGTLDSALQPVVNEGVPIVAYNHRLQNYKNFRVTFTMFDELYKEGVKFKVRYMNNVAEQLSEIRQYPFVEVRLCATRSEYIDSLRECSLNVTNSQHETFCISAIESMALGQPLIAPNSVTFPEITGAAAIKYPYLFDKTSEQKNMVRKLLTDQKERQKWGIALSDYVRSHFNSTLWAERYAALFERSLSVHLNPSKDALSALSATATRNRGSTLEGLLGHLYNVKVNGRQPFGSQSCTSTKLLRLLRRTGHDITIEAGQQIIR